MYLQLRQGNCIKKRFFQKLRRMLFPISQIFAVQACCPDPMRGRVKTGFYPPDIGFEKMPQLRKAQLRRLLVVFFAGAEKRKSYFQFRMALRVSQNGFEIGVSYKARFCFGRLFYESALAVIDGYFISLFGV